MSGLQVVATLDASARHPFTQKMLTALDRYNKPGVELTVDGYYYLLTGNGIQVRLGRLLGELPSMLNGVPIREIRVEDDGLDPSPQFGYFRSERAEGWVKPVKIHFDGKYFSHHATWKIEVVAPTFDEAKQLYIEMRHSQAQPARAWGSQPNVPAGDLSPMDALSPYASAEHKTNLAIQHLKRLLDRGEISMNDLIQQLSQANL